MYSVESRNLADGLKVINSFSGFEKYVSDLASRRVNAVSVSIDDLGKPLSVKVEYHVGNRSFYDVLNLKDKTVNTSDYESDISDIGLP